MEQADAELADTEHAHTAPLTRAEVHPLIQEFAERVVKEAAELATRHSDWTVESVLTEIGQVLPRISPRIKNHRISGYYIAMREEKKNAPPDLKFGGKGMSGEFAKWIAPRYQAKKEYYDEMAKKEREMQNNAKLVSTKQHHLALIKAVKKSVGIPPFHETSFRPPCLAFSFSNFLEWVAVELTIPNSIGDRACGAGP